MQGMELPGRALWDTKRVYGASASWSSTSIWQQRAALKWGNPLISQQGHYGDQNAHHHERSAPGPATGWPNRGQDHGPGRVRTPRAVKPGRRPGHPTGRPARHSGALAVLGTCLVMPASTRRDQVAGLGSR